MNAACCRTTHPPYQVQSQNPLRAEERDFSATSPLMIFCRELSRYLRLAAWPSLCAGTVIPRNARCAPLFRAAYPNLAIRALGCTRLRVRCRDRRLEFRFGRRATRGCRLWIDQGSSCNRQAREPPRRAAADAIAATVRSPAAPPSLLSTAIAALCVQAIWMTRAHSISSRGLAPSMNAKLAFTARSEIPLFGSRAAAISCCREAATNALEPALPLPK